MDWNQQDQGTSGFLIFKFDEMPDHILGSGSGLIQYIQKEDSAHCDSGAVHGNRACSMQPTAI